MKHRLIRIDESIAEHFSSLLQKYSRQGLRNGDALVAATRGLGIFPCSQEIPNIIDSSPNHADRSALKNNRTEDPSDF